MIRSFAHCGSLSFATEGSFSVEKKGDEVYLRVDLSDDEMRMVIQVLKDYLNREAV